MASKPSRLWMVCIWFFVNIIMYLVASALFTSPGLVNLIGIFISTVVFFGVSCIPDEYFSCIPIGGFCQSAERNISMLQSQRNERLLERIRALEKIIDKEEVI